MRWSVVVSLLAFSLANSAWADDRVDYLKQIKPLLASKCFACHGALKQEAGLRLDTVELMRKGGDSGTALAPGNSADSLLIHAVTGTNGRTRMPREAAPLKEEETERLRKWIDAGANGSPDESPEPDPREHWAFRKLARPPVPGAKSQLATPGIESRNPIDAFVAAKREPLGLSPLPPADKAVMLRRVHLDLVGLPPTADDVQAFLADDSDDGYEKVVNRLLESPQYGERWARHWMDIWRYSDWYGRRAVPDVMNSYPMIWRWRDWIVRSLNEDKGYDRMVLEMLAADEIAPTDDANIVATGFVVRSWFKWNYEMWMKDLVEHTGKAFVGLTLNCAQCHDHKYDPISQEEYFRFRAFFEPLELRHDRVLGEPDPGPFQKYVYAKSYGPIRSGLIRVFDEKLNAETFIFAKGDARLRLEGKLPVKPGAPALLGGDKLSIAAIDLPAEAVYPGLKAAVIADERTARQSAVATAEVELQAARRDAGEPIGNPSHSIFAAEAKLNAARAELTSLEARIAADQVRFASGPIGAAANEMEPAVRKLIHTACRAEREAAVATAKAKLAVSESAAAAAEVKVTQAKEQAAKDQAAKELQAAAQQVVAAKQALATVEANLQKELGEYTPLSPKYPTQSTGRRTALARWITDRENPLTARVAVNHIWQRHFGKALVETTHDFGRNGKRPTHLELLDWLACELMDSGWSMKHLHRLIVTSNTYRLRSNLSAESHPNEAVDRDNVTIWRFPPSRMQAEVIRDSLLFVAGELDFTMGGHEIDNTLGLTSRRRSLYFSHHGEGKMEFLELFDAANPCDCYKRTSSIQPQQALALSNSELTKSLSRQLASKLWTRAAADAAARHLDDAEPLASFVDLAFLQILNRLPSETERTATIAFLQQQPERLRTASGAAISDHAARARENFIHALMNHNDFVAVR